MKENYLPSPNFSKKERQKNSIKFVVIHYTGMQSERESIARLRDPKSKVSSHFLISQNGRIYRLVHDRHVAWHAGISFWKRYKNLNNHSIGIELVNKGHEFGYTDFSKKQLLSLVKICKKLIKKYKIKKQNIVGHSDIAPIRKIDPGEKFPWEKLKKNKIGIWHDFKPSFLKKLRKIKIYKKEDKSKFFKNLINIGYYIPNKNKYFLTKITEAFQRRFRRQLIDGLVDQECFVIAAKLAKSVKNS